MGEKKNQEIILRCFAYSGANGRREGFYAVCIDLNVFTWRPTLQEARKSLNDAIKGYLETVIHLAKEEKLGIEELPTYILRPSPFWPHKAMYYAYSFLGNIIKGTHIAFNKPIDISTISAFA